MCIFTDYWTFFLPTTDFSLMLNQRDLIETKSDTDRYNQMSINYYFATDGRIENIQYF